jgi:hypothetical protein
MHRFLFWFERLLIWPRREISDPCSFGHGRDETSDGALLPALMRNAILYHTQLGVKSQIVRAEIPVKVD